MTDFCEWLQGIPVICLMGLIYGVAFLLLPIAQWIDYKLMRKKYGKDVADEIMRRY